MTPPFKKWRVSDSVRVFPPNFWLGRNGARVMLAPFNPIFI